MKKILYLAIMLAAAMFMEACEISTASLSDAKICDSLEGDVCAEDKQVISTAAAAIYLSAQLADAPEGTSVTYTLTDRSTGEVLSTETWTAEEGGSGPFSISWNRPADGWVTGEYELTLVLGEDNSDPISKVFEIK